MKLYLDELIARGGFGRVYLARVTSSSRVYDSPVVVKKVHVTKHVRYPALQHEACAILLLKGHPSTPDAYAWGRSQYYEYLAMEMLGPELGSVLKAPSPLTMRNLVVLTCQMLDAIEHVHGHGIVHCDIKPNNLLFTLDGTRLKLIDFGVSQCWRDRETGCHTAPSTVPHTMDNDHYMSIPVHRHHNVSRRDDIESLAYTVVKLLCGSLPWRDEGWENILRTKLAWSGTALCAGYPAVFADLVDSARAMAFDETPDYDRWRRELHALVPEGLAEDALFDAKHSEEPHVGKPGTPAVAPREAGEADVDQVDSWSEDSSFNCHSDDRWMPTSSWPPPHILKATELFGCEADMVKSGLERIEEPPGMKSPYLYFLTGPDEIMVKS